MNKPLIRLAGLAVLLFLIALAFSCGSPQPTVQNQNQNGGNVNMAIVIPDKSCDTVDINARRTDVENALKKLIDDDNQLGGHISVKVEIVNNKYLQAVINGYAGGDDELEDLAKIIRKVMHKQDCVRKVYFVNTSGVVPTAGNPGDVGFLWTACEWPKIVCPDGSCCDMVSDTNANANTNTMTNTNANSNANTNTNANHANAAPSNGNGH